MSTPATNPQVPDVDNLQYFPVEGGVRLTWHWPEQYLWAKVLAESEGQPGQVGASQQLDDRVARPVYEQDGDSYYLPLNTAAAAWRITVLAVVNGEISPGVGEGCTCQIPKKQRVRLKYSVSRQGRELLVRLQPHPGCRNFGFVVQGSDQGVPQKASLGHRLFPVPDLPQPGWPDHPKEDWYEWGVPVPPALSAAQHLYFRLFLDPDTDWIAVEHPGDIFLGLGGPPIPKMPERLRMPPTPPRYLLCPYCLDRFGWWQARLWENGRERWATSLLRRFGASTKLLRWADTNEFTRLKLVCPKSCRQKRQKTRKPVELDNDLFRFPMVFLALYGASGTGKSHWAFGVYLRMKGYLGLMVFDDNTRELLNKMRETVLDHKQALRATHQDPGEVVPPLLFGGVAEGREIVLALHDIDGEFCQWSETERGMRYWRACHGLIVMLDPLHMPLFRKVVGKNLPADAPDDAAVGDQTKALESLKRVLANCPRLSQGPVAVVVSRGDVVLQFDDRMRDALGSVPAFQASTRSITQKTPKYDMGLHWRVQFAVRDFLSKYDPDTLGIFQTPRFSNVAYFCVAPAGSSAVPKGDYKEFPRIAPWRVEEPTMWLLSQLNVIQAF
jgi:hypothetical protein